MMAGDEAALRERLTSAEADVAAYRELLALALAELYEQNRRVDRQSETIRRLASALRDSRSEIHVLEQQCLAGQAA